MSLLASHVMSHDRHVSRYQAVESMRQGLSPTEAAREALKRITAFYPDFRGALVAINITGHYGEGLGNILVCMVSLMFGEFSH